MLISECLYGSHSYGVIIDDAKRGIDMTVPTNGSEGLPVVLSGLDCNGTESTLSRCNHSQIISQCGQATNAGARCSK